jgi:hypothetical protein
MIKRSTLISELAIFCGVIIVFLVLLPPFIIDDTFVYFTYARNFSEGRFFAYDVRNIPSEGFTSMLYMLLLVPFEFFKINLSFVGIAFNAVALAFSITLVTWLLRVTNFLKEHFATLFASTLALFIIADQNVKKPIAAGFETMIGLLCIIGIVVMITLAINQNNSNIKKEKAITFFYVFSFIAHMVRPEYIMMLAIGGLLLIWQYNKRRELIFKGIIFIIFFTVFYLLKFAIFSDIFPTGFYRKVTLESSGLAYIQQWISDYSLFILLGLLSSISFYSLLKRVTWLWLLVVFSLVIVIFFTRALPLIDIGYRFLIIPVWTVYVLVSLGVALLAQSLTARFFIRLSFTRVLRGVLFGSIISVLAVSIFEGRIFNTYQRIAYASQQHPYIQLSDHLKSFIPDVSTLTFVFNEAGVLPYSLGGRYIDTHGLTEPFIARLFGLPNNTEKKNLYIDYILSYNPDVIIVGFGRADDEGIWESFFDPNSPFRGPTPASVFQAYRDYGMVYACSIISYYDLHVTVNRSSPHYEKLLEALRSYKNIYVLSDGLTVSSEGELIKFPLADSNSFTSTLDTFSKTNKGISLEEKSSRNYYNHIQPYSNKVELR